MRGMAKPLNPQVEVIRSNLERFIAESGYSVTMVADLSGIPQASLGRYVKGTHALPAEYIQPLAEVFGRAPGDFYTAAPPPADKSTLLPVMFRSRPDVHLTQEDQKDIDELKSKLLARRKKKSGK